jgi:hypothetical protein
MRRAARLTAERFSDLQVTRRWAAELAEVAAVRQRERSARPLRLPDPTLEAPGVVPLPW